MKLYHSYSTVLNRQSGSALVEIMLIIALSALIFIVLMKMLVSYPVNMKLSLDSQQDIARINDVMQAAARYGRFCPSPGRGLMLSDLVDTKYLADNSTTNAGFKNVNSNSLTVTVSPGLSLSASKVTFTSILLDTLKPNEITYYHHALGAIFNGDSFFYITRYYVYPTYSPNDFGLGHTFDSFTGDKGAFAAPCI